MVTMDYHSFPITHHRTEHSADVFGVTSAGHVSSRVTTEIQAVIQDREANVQNAFFELFKMGPYVMMKEMTRVQELHW